MAQSETLIKSHDERRWEKFKFERGRLEIEDRKLKVKGKGIKLQGVRLLTYTFHLIPDRFLL